MPIWVRINSPTHGKSELERIGSVKTINALRSTHEMTVCTNDVVAITRDGDSFDGADITRICGMPSFKEYMLLLAAIN